MTDPTIALKHYLINIGLQEDADFLRDGVELLSQMVMELEVEQQIGAGKHERTPERSKNRNGYRERTWETRVGEIELAIPKLRQGSYFPSLFEPRRPAEKALLTVVSGSLPERIKHPEGRCSDEGYGFDRHRQEQGFADMQRTGSGGGTVSQSPFAGKLSVCLVGCALPQGAPEPSHRKPGPGESHGRG